MSSTSIAVTISANAQETFDASEQPTSSNESNRTLRVDSLNLSTSLYSTSTPKVDKPPIYKKITLAGSTVTIDLTAAPCLASPSSVTRAVDMTGAKLKLLQVKAAKTNANVINVAPGASNPYPFLGAGNDFSVGPGQVLCTSFDGVDSNLPAVGPTAKTIDISGATSGDVIEILIGMGT
ncbi:MAG: hypothetical protein ACO1RA_02320 [Planctomycetaceae bacterium]